MHIDFGFILEISPGGNMRFESAAFKLSHEMTLLVDPGGGRASREFRDFEDLVVRGYLAVRAHSLSLSLHTSAQGLLHLRLVCQEAQGRTQCCLAACVAWELSEIVGLYTFTDELHILS